jgi:DNA mismatch repair protein MutS2
MNTDIEQILEFDKIRNTIAGLSVSELGKSLAKNLKPISDMADIERMLDIISEAKRINIVEGGFPLSGLQDIRQIMKKASIVGTILEPLELLNVASTMRVARNLRSFAKEFFDKYPIIYEIIDNLNTFSDIEESVSSSIDHEGNILDSASPELYRIRRQIFAVRERITRQLGSILRSPDYQTAIQEDVITLRNDRYVIPVKQNQRGSVPGITQGRSASGITAFVEPNAVVELNNELQELISDELIEIRRILGDITDRIRRAIPQLQNSIQILAEIDLINAKSLLCVKLGTTRPELNQNGYINLIKARHPILQMNIDERNRLARENNTQNPEKIVSIDFYIGDEFNTLVITGPNTGGKTVALKTVGLLTLMMQTGLHVPVGDGSKMSIFNEVFADIGDEQSIEQNLSTFSSHITRINRIIKQLDDSSLVLLDELGAGTEPSEGAALGMAILDYLHSRGVRTVATTHHDSLKAHVYSSEGMENASVAFDLATLKPTYELRIGLPGSSNALKIADRLGLPKEIIDNAKKHLNPNNIQIADLISNVEEMQKELEEQKKIAEERTISAFKTQQAHELLLSQLKSSKKEVEREALAEASKIIEKTKLLMENTIAELKKEKATPESIHKARQVVYKAREDVAKAIQKTKYEKPEDQMKTEGREAKRDELKIGDDVYVKSLQFQGTLASLPDSKDIVQVLSGSAKISVPISDIRLLSKSAEKKVKDNRYSAVNLQTAKISNISSTLDLRGHRVLEAIEKTDKFLDDAAIANLPSISIIHGHGTGALRQAITELLNEHPQVANHYFAPPKEGGQGVTIVELR